MKASLGDDVNPAAEQLLDRVAELDEGKPSVTGDIVDEQIDVAVFACVPPRDGAEHPDVLNAVSSPEGAHTLGQLLGDGRRDDRRSRWRRTPQWSMVTPTGQECDAVAGVVGAAGPGFGRTGQARPALDGPPGVEPGAVRLALDLAAGTLECWETTKNGGAEARAVLRQRLAQEKAR